MYRSKIFIKIIITEEDLFLFFLFCLEKKINFREEQFFFLIVILKGFVSFPVIYFI